MGRPEAARRPTAWNCGSTRRGSKPPRRTPKEKAARRRQARGVVRRLREQAGTCGSRSAASRPTVVKAGDAAIVRFDGEDDHLRFTGGKGELKDVHGVPRARAADATPAASAGFFALNAPNGRDYETGLTIDMGPNGTPRFTDLNVEGKGFGGWRNLMKTGRRLRQALSARSARRRRRRSGLVVDGAANGERAVERRAAQPRRDHRRRRLLHQRPRRAGGPRARAVRHRRGAALRPRADRRRGEEGPRLPRRQARRAEAEPAAGRRRRRRAARAGEGPAAGADASCPGFTVRNCRSTSRTSTTSSTGPTARSSRSATTATSGTLTDTDGDGLEDKAELFWESKGRLRGPIGMDLTPPDYKHGEGVFVASQGEGVADRRYRRRRQGGQGDRRRRGVEGDRAQRRRARRRGRPEGRQRLLRPRHARLRQRAT